ncbi:MAG: rod shape-determining protein MreC, partial [Flavobacterium sp.]
KIYIDNQTNFYTIDVRLFNDMTSLGHVYIIKNKDRDEINDLEKRTEKNE